MNATTTKAPPAPAIPEDDPTRQAAVARPDDDQTLAHWGVVGDTYTILISGEQTAGRYTLIDMHIPTGGGPPPHRHDFEEMFSVIDGAIEVTLRGDKKTASAGETINTPANAPHVFKNTSQQPARSCACARPPGRRSSSPRSEPPSQPGPRQHPSSMTQRKKRSWRRRSPWHPHTTQSYSSHNTITRTEAACDRRRDSCWRGRGAGAP